jgi:hypothetical protein
MIEGGTRHSMGGPTKRKSGARLGCDVQARIGQQLRAMYDYLLGQGESKQIAELVRRLTDQDDGMREKSE